MTIDANRIWADLMELARITEPNKPYTRRSFSPLFLEGRQWLAQKFRDAGLDLRIDSGGNLIGRREGSSPLRKTIMLGSHSDTVPQGGRFDGIAGVVAALEVARTLRDQRWDLNHPLEIVDFLAEEPSEYGLSCVGSRAMAGVLSDEMLTLTAPGKGTLAEGIAAMGGAPARLGSSMRGDVACFLELHIEQGVVLETARIDIGIVTAIVGITRIEILLEGRADHAGTTPMRLRRDAAVAAARIVDFVSGEASRIARDSNEHFTATAGIVEVMPNAANVVPGAVRLVIDIRAEHIASAKAFVSRLDEESTRLAESVSVARNGWRILSWTNPTTMAQELRGTLSEAAQALRLSTMDLASGAGHDAAMIAKLAQAAMIFIPCRDGRSHAPDEWAEPEALANGTNVLLDAVVRLDRSLP